MKSLSVRRFINIWHSQLLRSVKLKDPIKWKIGGSRLCKYLQRSKLITPANCGNKNRAVNFYLLHNRWFCFRLFTGKKLKIRSIRKLFTLFNLLWLTDWVNLTDTLHYMVSIILKNQEKSYWNSHLSESFCSVQAFIHRQTSSYTDKCNIIQPSNSRMIQCGNRNRVCVFLH